LSLPNSGQDTAGWLNSQTVLEKYKRRQYIEYKIHKKTKIRRKMFTSLLFCAGFVAVLSTASVSSESRVDFTPYSALLALLTGNRDLALQSNPYHYQRRYYSQHGSKHFNLSFLFFFFCINYIISTCIKCVVLFTINYSSTLLSCWTLVLLSFI
jgi:hypothetical protein